MEEKDEIEQDVEEEEEFDEEGEETGAPEEGGAAKKKKKRKKKRRRRAARRRCVHPGGQLFDIVQGGGSEMPTGATRGHQSRAHRRGDTGPRRGAVRLYRHVGERAEVLRRLLRLVQRGSGGSRRWSRAPPRAGRVGLRGRRGAGHDHRNRRRQAGGVLLRGVQGAARPLRPPGAVPREAAPRLCEAPRRPGSPAVRHTPRMRARTVVRRQQQQQQQQSEEGRGQQQRRQRSRRRLAAGAAAVAHPPSSDDWTMAVRGALGDLPPHLPPTVGADCFRAAAEGHGREGQQEQAVLDGLVGLGLRINSNSHGMRDLEGRNANVGIGLFPTFAMFNHSCAPNCVFAFSPSRRCMEVRAIEDVDARDGGTELCVSYIDLYQPTGVRREELKQTKHFLCVPALRRSSWQRAARRGLLQRSAAAAAAAAATPAATTRWGWGGWRCRPLLGWALLLVLQAARWEEWRLDGRSDTHAPSPIPVQPRADSEEPAAATAARIVAISTLSAQEEEDALVAAFDDLNGAKASVNSLKRQKPS